MADKTNYGQVLCACGHKQEVHKFGKRYYEWTPGDEYPHNERLTEYTSLDGCKHCGCVSFGNGDDDG